MSLTRSFFVGISLLSAAAPVAFAQQHFTLDQVMGAPFSSDLVAARRGSSVAWIVNQRGARNVWVSSGPSWQARQVTSYRDDDGQEIESLRFTPDGRSVVFVVNGDRVERRAVSLGDTGGDRVGVLSGVSPGERVVIDGPQTLKDGDKVKVQ